MKVLVTGATGFVGRWLVRELESAGHEVTATDTASLDVTDSRAVVATVRELAPDAIAHLAGVSFAGDARKDPGLALRVNLGGTVAVVEAARSLTRPPVVLVTGSSEVYGAPVADDIPLRESAPLRATAPYGLSKVAAEGAAVALGLTHRIPVVVARPFNHIGPGQRSDFVVPALARRIAAARRDGVHSIAVGNVDVRRDFLDVRDVVRAYRLLLEGGATFAAERPFVVNIASGRSVSIREIAQGLMQVAGHEVELSPDPGLVRPDDPLEIRGDAARLTAATGWRPSIALDQTLLEVMHEQLGSAGGGAP